MLSCAGGCKCEANKSFVQHTISSSKCAWLYYQDLHHLWGLSVIYHSAASNVQYSACSCARPAICVGTHWYHLACLGWLLFVVEVVDSWSVTLWAGSRPCSIPLPHMLTNESCAVALTSQCYWPLHKCWYTIWYVIMTTPRWTRASHAQVSAITRPICTARVLCMLSAMPA